MLRGVLHGFLSQCPIKLVPRMGINAGKKAGAKRVRVMNLAVLARDIVDTDAVTVLMGFQVAYDMLACADGNMQVSILFEMVVPVQKGVP